MHPSATKSCLLVVGLGIVCAAGPAAIGIATARGSFLIDGSSVAGNATLLDGMVITSLKAASRLEFQNGAMLLMAPDARVKVHMDRAVLQRGSGELRGSPGFSMEAAGMRVQPSASVRVSMQNDAVTVAALRGAAKIFNSDGVLVTEVGADSAYTVEQDAPANTSMAGCLISVADRYVLLDQGGTTGIELRGSTLNGLVNTRIEAKGKNSACAEPLAGTTRVVQVSETKAIQGLACTNARDTFMAAHPGISTEKRTRQRCKVIAGVIVTGAAAGGITAAVCCKDEKAPVSVQ